jgi:hypothetical protein
MSTARPTAQAHAASILSLSLSLFPFDDSTLPFSLQQHWREEIRMVDALKRRQGSSLIYQNLRFLFILLFIYPKQ